MKYLKSLWQKVTRGFSDKELDDFYVEIYKFLYPRLKRFEELEYGCPSDLSDQEWHDMLKKMILACYWIINDNNEFNSAYTEEELMRQGEQIKEGKELFFKYHRYLMM